MSSDADGYLAVYQEHSKVLRTWLVAYGIAAPVLLMTHEVLLGKVILSRCAVLIAGLFLCGVVLQVVLAATNKAAMWGLYYGETNPAFKSTRAYALADRFSAMFWIDLLVDWVSLGVFGAATWLVVRAVLV